MPENKTLLYLLRKDLRVADNPILHALSENKHGFTHLLPVYVFQPHQIEVTGFLKDGEKSLYPEARSVVGDFWRCGPLRAKFLAESVWDLKTGLEKLGSGLEIRIGPLGDVARRIIKADKLNVGAVWMTNEEGVEEKDEEKGVKNACEKTGVDFKLWDDEKYLVDDRDLGKVKDPQELPDVFTSYRKMMEPLRDVSRDVLPPINKLPPVPENLPRQPSPFAIPDTLPGLIETLQRPLTPISYIPNPLPYPEDAKSAHPFTGGESQAQDRLDHLLKSGAMSAYKDTRNGMLGTDFSSKLSAFLAIGSITARQINSALKLFEDGSESKWEAGEGYGKGQNKGTEAMRFELLWRDYMRLCTRKYGGQLFQLEGFKRKPDANERWASLDSSETQAKVKRFLNGTTGMGLIDASQREIYHTGYTSNRARQNVASFLAKHLYIDWRIGAEYYEMMLVDYDVSSNWGNWQYVAGVGNDPRDDARIFNPVKQSFDYDAKGAYIKMWVSELRGLTEPSEIFQAWTVPVEERKAKGLEDGDAAEMWEHPLKKIDFTIGRRSQRGRGNGRAVNRGRGGRGNGGGGGGGGRGNGGSNLNPGNGYSNMHRGGIGHGSQLGGGNPNANQHGWGHNITYGYPMNQNGYGSGNGYTGYGQWDQNVYNHGDHGNPYGHGGGSGRDQRSLGAWV